MFKIKNRLIGPGQPCFIIAEAGVNHNGSIEIITRESIDAADHGSTVQNCCRYLGRNLATICKVGGSPIACT